MHKQGYGDFKYFVGISSLAQIATREDSVLPNATAVDVLAHRAVESR